MNKVNKREKTLAKRKRADNIESQEYYPLEF